jgi:dipeptidyl aminopeptidase/acylaminoacyl peptidase
MTRWPAARLTAAALLVVAVAVGLILSLGASTSRAVAYVTGDGATTTIWLRSLDGGSPRRIGAGSDPLLAPDGSLIAASAPAGSRSALLVYRTGGGAPHAYFAGQAVSATPLAFSPDGRRLAVALSSRDPVSAAGSGLVLIDTGSLRARLVARGQIEGASFSPDSSRLAYAAAPSPALSAPVNISVLHLMAGARQPLTDDGRSLNPVWGPRGIVFDRERLRRNGEPAYSLWLMRADGARARPLVTQAVPRMRNGLQPVAFDPGGQRLLADYVGPNTSQAWLVGLAGSRPRATPLPGGASGAGVGSDGSLLLIGGGIVNPPSQQRIESRPASGGRATVLVAGGAEASWDG